MKNGFYIILVSLLFCISPLSFALVHDADKDGIADELDNCIDVANPKQMDIDRDGFGNQCDADFDNNNIVDIADYYLLLESYGGADLNFDLNADGRISIADYFVLATAIFTAPGPSGIAQP